jgi:hypothetical protein
MKTKLILLGLVSTAALTFQSFDMLSEPQRNSKKLTPTFQHKNVTSSTSENVQISLYIESSTNAIITLRIYRVSDCLQYLITSFSGGVHHSGNNYYADNISVTLDGGATVSYDGLLDPGPGCDGALN